MGGWSSTTPFFSTLAINAAADNNPVLLTFRVGVTRFRIRERTGTIAFRVGRTVADVNNNDYFTFFAGEVMQETDMGSPHSLAFESGGVAATLEVVQWE